MAFDEYGNLVPDETYYDREKFLNWFKSTPSEPPTAPEPAAPAAPPAPPQPQEPVAAQGGPSFAQKSLKEMYGIGTTGPLADQATQNAADFRNQKQSYFDTTGQHEPQQYGVAETGVQFGPRTPADTAEAMYAAGPVRGVSQKPRLPETPEQIRRRNEQYDAYVTRSRAKREQERNQLRDSALVNRERRDARRDYDEDMWSDMRMATGSTGGMGMGGMSGPQVTYSGGAAFVGPGFGRETYGGGRGGVRTTYDPQLPERIAQRERERVSREHGQQLTNDTRLKSIEGQNTRAENALEGQNKRAKDVLNFRSLQEAKEARGEFDRLMVQYKNNQAKWFKSKDATAMAVQDRIIELGQALNQATRDGVYDFQVTPDVFESIKTIKAERDAANMVRQEF